MHTRYFLLLALFLGMISCSVENDQYTVNQHMKLWYDEPASIWEEALPIGNGRLGAMVYGDPVMEHLQINEETVWAGEPGNNIKGDLKPHLANIRKLIFEGKHKEAQAFANSVFPRRAGEDNNYGMCYQPVGDLFIEFPGHKNVTEYYRDLDISQALSIVSYSLDGSHYKREVFTSFTDDVLIVKFSTDNENGLSCKLSLKTDQKGDVKVEDGRLILNGVSGDYENKKGKVRFCTLVEPKMLGGNMVSSDSIILVQNAKELVLYVSTGTNFKNYKDLSGDAFAVAYDKLQKALLKDYQQARADHIAFYENYFNRVNLDLGTTDSVHKTTDVRLAEFATADDPQLVSLYFQFGRYLLISGSQPGGQPANLQGIWNNKMRPPWDSKYTVNINTEMNYWPAEVTALPEMHEPLFAMLKELSVTGKESAATLYDARGWNMHHNTDLWRITGPIDGAYYGLWPMGGAWLSQHLWQHYLYSGSVEFLEEYYPVLKGVAQFYVDAMVREPQTGWMVMCPSMSPENTHHSGTTIAGGTTMDNQLIFDVFSNAIRTSELLETDKAFADTLKDLMQQLPPMQIGKWGQLQEWMHDWDSPNDKHRHVSHLYGLYPSNQISPYKNPDLFEASRTSLVARGDRSTGWSMGWKVNLWARLLDGDRAYKLIKDQLTPSIQADGLQEGGTYPNLFDAHPPFQIDGNFGCTSGISEMLVQSHDGAIQILPALPQVWDSGHINGIKARGGFTLDIMWENGELKTASILSALGGNCRIRSYVPLSGKGLTEAQGDNPNSFYQGFDIKEPLNHAETSVEHLQLKPVYEYDVNTEKGDVIFVEKI